MPFWVLLLAVLADYGQESGLDGRNGPVGGPKTMDSPTTGRQHLRGMSTSFGAGPSEFVIGRFTTGVISKDRTGKSFCFARVLGRIPCAGCTPHANLILAALWA